MVSQNVPDHQDALPLVCELDKLLAFMPMQSQWFLHKNILVVLEASTHQLKMLGSGCGNCNCMYFWGFEDAIQAGGRFHAVTRLHLRQHFLASVTDEAEDS